MFFEKPGNYYVFILIYYFYNHFFKSFFTQLEDFMLKSRVASFLTIIMIALFFVACGDINTDSLKFRQGISDGLSTKTYDQAYASEYLASFLEKLQNIQPGEKLNAFLQGTLPELNEYDIGFLTARATLMGKLSELRNMYDGNIPPGIRGVLDGLGGENEDLVLQKDPNYSKAFSYCSEQMTHFATAQNQPVQNENTSLNSNQNLQNQNLASNPYRPLSSSNIPPQGISGWADSRYAADRDKVIKLYDVVKSVFDSRPETARFVGDQLVLNFATEKFDNGDLYISIDTLQHYITITAPTQPNNKVRYSLDSKVGFEVANIYSLGNNTNRMVPVFYQGTTSFLTGSGTPANDFYDVFANDLVYKSADLLPLGSQLSTQGVFTASKNGLRKIGETISGWFGWAK